MSTRRVGLAIYTTFFVVGDLMHFSDLRSSISEAYYFEVSTCKSLRLPEINFLLITTSSLSELGIYTDNSSFALYVESQHPEI